MTFFPLFNQHPFRVFYQKCLVPEVKREVNSVKNIMVDICIYIIEQKIFSALTV